MTPTALYSLINEPDGGRRVRRPVKGSGWRFSSTDYKAGELFTHAQSCIWLVGFSDLATALLKDVDPHTDLAAMVLGVTYQEFLKRKKERRFSDARQASKPPNFGNPGGMGDYKLVYQQRRQGPDTPCPNGNAMIEVENDAGIIELVPGYKGLRFCILMNAADRCGSPRVQSWGRVGYEREIPPTCRACLECAGHLKKIWKLKWRENVPYFKFVSDCIDEGQVITSQMLDRWPWLKDFFRPGQRLLPGQIMQHVVGRVRQLNVPSKESPFCAGSNGFFQALLSEITKRAYWRATRECYDHTYRIGDGPYENSRPSRFARGPSPLLGSRIPGFFHDELFGEHPEETAEDGAWRISEIMTEEIMGFCPDVAKACLAEPALMAEWNKAAAPVIHADRLVPWTREHKPQMCAECKAQAAVDEARKKAASATARDQALVNALAS